MAIGLFKLADLFCLKNYDITLEAVFRLLDVNLLFFSGVSYNIPVQLWLQERHPYAPPLVFVTPTSTMAIKSSLHVDTNGKVYHSYLNEWKHSSQVCLLNNIHFFMCKIRVFFLTNIHPILFFASLSFLCV